jgi:predicted CopG family antitoxin
MKSVKVSDDVWEQLTLLKLRLRVKTYNDVIKHLLSKCGGG